MISVDIELDRGEFRLRARFDSDAPIVGLFGRSGSGKTSLVNAIAGIVKPRRGHIRLNNVTLFDSEERINVPAQHRRVGYVFQDALLFPHLSVESNLLYGHRLRAPGELRIETQRVIELLGLTGMLRRKPNTLSGGEKQRVAIGRALLAQPRVLLMDEPLASLDVQRKTEILDYIEALRDVLHIPIVYVSHSVPEITRLADTVVLLSDGESLAVGEADEVMGRFATGLENGGFDAGSLIDTHVLHHHPADRLTTLSFDGGELTVPLLNAATGERVRAFIQSKDVSLAIEKPRGISILNVLAGEVKAIDDARGAVLNVHVVVGNTVLAARITRRSLEQLRIERGQKIYVMIKAVSFDERSVGYA